MDTIMIRGIKTFVEKENIDECYLNPKDNIINEHYNQLLFKTLPMNLLFYLPLNEILAVVLEEKVVIYDIKLSVIDSLKIIDEIFYKDIINEFSDIIINKIDEKIDKNKKTAYFMGLNFIAKEQEDKQIKNIIISDDFYDKKGSFVMIIEFMNLDIYIVEYNLLNEINNNPKFSLILKADKTMFIDKKTNADVISKLNDNYYKNSYKTKFKIIKYLNSKIFFLYQHQYNFYIYSFKINEITLHSYTNNKKRNKNKNIESNLLYNKICLNKESINFDVNYCFNEINYIDYFEFITIGVNNEIFYHLFFLENGNGNKKIYKEIINKEITIDNKANISNIKYANNVNNSNLFCDKIFFMIQLNKIFVVNYFIERDKANKLSMNIKYKYLLNIVEFSEEQIYDVFLLQKQYLYIFTRKSKYIEYILDLQNMKNNKNTEIISINETPKFFRITKFIYDIKPFQSENGFFILITQNSIRPINMNIIYKINHSSLTKINDSFSEGLILGLRNPKENIEFINDKNSFIFNKRYNYFINKIFKGQNPYINKKDRNKNNMDIEEDQSDLNEENEEKEEIENDEGDIENKYENDDLMNINSDKYKNMEKISIKENESIKKEIIDFYIKKQEFIFSKEDYLKFLDNENYICEFCGEKFKSFEENERIYKCNNDDVTFSCCLSKMPINNDFLWCSYCQLFYSYELNNFYCIVCDKILTTLDTL